MAPGSAVRISSLFQVKCQERLGVGYRRPPFAYLLGAASRPSDHRRWASD